MMPQLYTVLDLQPLDTGCVCQIEWLKAHPIYDGHFPGQPVVPGVCLIQMVVEIASQALGQSLQLIYLTQAKFLNPIHPTQTPHLTLSLTTTMTSDAHWKLRGTLYHQQTEFLKINALAAAIVSKN